MGSGLLYNLTTIQTNLCAGCKSALQPRNNDRLPIWKQKHLKTSDIFSLPRISTKDFPYIKGKIDRSIGINYSSVNFKWTQVFLCYQSFDTLGARNFSCAVSGFGQVSQRSMNFLKIQVIQDKSKPTRVAMIWLRVKVNRTRLKYNKIAEELRKRTCPLHTSCLYGSLFVIYTAL